MNPQHFEHLAALLDMEGRAEHQQLADRIAQGRGRDSETSLVGLVVRSEDPGLATRLLLTLGKRSLEARLPPHRLQSGSPVVLTELGSADPVSVRGVLSHRHVHTITVAIEAPEESLPEDVLWRVDLSPDEISRQRQKNALDVARRATRGRFQQLRDVLIEKQTPRFSAISPLSGPLKGLNASQVEAVEFALSAKDIALIHGPPGTGKTTTVAELIREIRRRGETLLVCAPSNTAVDNLLEKLVETGEKAVRLGHPARVAEHLREHTLDYLAEEHNDTKQARKLARQAYALFRQSSKWTRGKPEPGAKRAFKEEGRELLREARLLEDQAVDRILAATPIVCATLTGVDDRLLGERRFDWLIIDEACQSPEPACWIALARCDRVVLAGDPFQLPPTIVSPEAARQGLNISLMERLLSAYGDNVARLLTTQYRMHADIARFSSHEFYGGRLIADASVVGHLLRDLEGIADAPPFDSPIEFIDTAGAGFDEEEEEEGSSRENPQEANLTIKVVRELLAGGLTAAQVSVITPYNAQARLIRAAFPDGEPEVDSVDGFQGREKEAIVVSLVRSNHEGKIGFLADTRRMNVAMTRARRKLVLIGDSATLGANDFFARLLTSIEANGLYRSVWEMMD